MFYVTYFLPQFKKIKIKACEKDTGINLKLLLMINLVQILQQYNDNNGLNL